MFDLIKFRNKSRCCAIIIWWRKYFLISDFCSAAVTSDANRTGKSDIFESPFKRVACRVNVTSKRVLTSRVFANLPSRSILKDLQAFRFDQGRKKLFGGVSTPSPADYETLGDTYGRRLERWQTLPAVSGFFFILDAELQLKNIGTEAFLSEIMEDVIHEGLIHQVEREYLLLWVRQWCNRWRFQYLNTKKVALLALLRAAFFGETKL